MYTAGQSCINPQRNHPISQKHFHRSLYLTRCLYLTITTLPARECKYILTPRYLSVLSDFQWPDIEGANLMTLFHNAVYTGSSRSSQQRHGKYLTALPTTDHSSMYILSSSCTGNHFAERQSTYLLLRGGGTVDRAYCSTQAHVWPPLK